MVMRVPIALLAILAACSGTAQLHPINATAQAIEPLQLSYKEDGWTGGSCTVVMPDGEVLTGRFEEESGSTYSHGAIVKPGQKPIPTSSWSYGPSHGVASLVGDHGTLMDCE